MSSLEHHNLDGGEAVVVNAGTSSTTTGDNNTTKKNKKERNKFRFHFGNDGEEKDACDARSRMMNDHGIAQWPFDDYHEVQSRYYQTIDDKNNNNTNTPVSSQQPQFLTRPPDLVDIPTAVQNLPLSDFSRTAEDRAIGIVSTWIFDAGLMEESHMTLDKEIAKLTEQTERDLALINNRLNDGVAASGAEVQELVNAVQSTKADIQKLDATIENIQAADQVTPFLMEYPKIQAATDAKSNLNRCFRELDFFAQIPAVCRKLRETLTSCEWTEHEWTTLRDVGKEHVELQLFLCEAETGMKARLGEDVPHNISGYDGGGSSATTGTPKTLIARGNSFRYVPSDHNSVDSFLKEHVENVWEVGDEIRLRILSGIAGAVELCQKDPAGMVALVEAVEVYEMAAEEFNQVHGSKNKNKHLGKVKEQNNGNNNNDDGKDDDDEEWRDTRSHNSILDMRRAALEQIAKDFEDRANDVFDQIQINQDPYAADAETAEFNGTLRAANTLIYQMKLVQSHMSPCFPTFWHMEILWMTCVAAVCSKQILKQIGGQEGKNCEHFTVTQLLDLVAWIESFKETVEDAFPQLLDTKTNAASRRSNSDKPAKVMTLQELMSRGKVDLESAKDNLQYVVNILWDVHTIAQDQFIFRTRQQTNEWLENVYNADHAKNQTNDGRLTTSLPEDVWALSGVQLRTIRERLTKKSGVLVDAFVMVFSAMQLKQRECYTNFCGDLEECCAAANDFVRMTEECDTIVDELLEHTELSDIDIQTVQEVANELLRQFTNDAVYAAQAVHVFIMEPIQEELQDKLFVSEEWKEGKGERVHAQTIVRTVEDYLGDINEWMEEVMVRKCIDGLVRASVNFYIGQLLLLAYTRTKKKGAVFDDPDEAMNLINADVKAIRGYFENLAQESFPSLKRVIMEEFEILKTVFGILWMAKQIEQDKKDSTTNNNENNNNHHDEFMEENAEQHASFFPRLFQSLDYNLEQTRLVLGDLYSLVGGWDAERCIYEIWEQNGEEPLRALEQHTGYNNTGSSSSTGEGMLNLSKYLQELLKEKDRKRPIKKGGFWSKLIDNDDEKEKEKQQQQLLQQQQQQQLQEEEAAAAAAPPNLKTSVTSGF